jgi:lipopolysaccharide export system permease protein
MGETIAPRGEQKAEQLQLTAKAKDISVGKAGANWARDGNTIVNAKHSRRRVVNGAAVIELSDVRVFEFTARGQLAALAVAKTAVHDGHQWVLHDVRRTEFAGGIAKSTEESERRWDSALDPNVLALSVTHPDNMSAADLSRNIDYMRRNHQDATPYEKSYWARVFYPLNVLVLAFCAVPFAFGALRTGGLGKRLFIGMALAVSYSFMQRSVVSMGAVYNFNMALANAMPSLLLALAALFYFRRHA